MDTAMSVKRSFVSDRNAPKPAVRRSETNLALYALIAGILLLVVGAKAAVDIVTIVGFFFAASGALALNSLFWASYYGKHGEPKISARRLERYRYE